MQEEVDSRPRSLFMLAVMSMILGILIITGAFIVAYASIFAAFYGAMQAVLGFGLALLVLITGILHIAFAVGILSRKPWAWTLGVVTELLLLASGLLYTLFVSPEPLIPLAVIVIAVIVLAYLFTPDVRRALGGARSKSASLPFGRRRLSNVSGSRRVYSVREPLPYEETSSEPNHPHQPDNPSR